MIRYKLYCLDGQSKVAGPPRIVEAETNLEAIDAAEALMIGSHCELWQGARLVTRVPVR